MTAANILGGIAARLRGIYPDSFYSIYTESVQQDLLRPCFFILLKKQEQKRELGRRFRQKYSFEVVYYPSDGGGNEECIAVSQAIQRSLEYIKANGDYIRGKTVSCRIEGGKLRILIDYTLFLIEEAEKYEYMEEVFINGRTGS